MPDKTTTFWPVRAMAVSAMAVTSGLGGAACKDERASAEASAQAPAQRTDEGAEGTQGEVVNRPSDTKPSDTKPSDNDEPANESNQTLPLANPLDDSLRAPADPSCTEGFPPPEDPAFQRTQRLTANAPEAESILASMTLDEKLTVLSGYLDYDWADGTAFEAASVERVNYPAFRMRDGARGVRGIFREPSTTFPVGQARGASFDIDLEERIGRVFAAELRALRGDVVLAPTVNVLRHPAWGRAQETYGEDPVVLGELGAAFVRGVQGGAQGMPACVKHYAGNNSEDNRGGNNDHGVDAIIDEQTLRENYVRAFQIIVEKADPACVMTAYNDVNGQSNTENTHLLADILRSSPSGPQHGFGWKGFVVSDWGSTLGPGHGALAQEAGLDIEMPDPLAFSDLGEENAAGIERAARRVLDVRATFGQLSSAYLEAHAQPPDASISDTPSHRALAREAAEKGAVLLKNASVLPLRTEELDSIVFLGPDRIVPRIRPVMEPHGLGDGGSSQTHPPYVVSFMEGVSRRAQGSVTQSISVTQSNDALSAIGKSVAIIPVTMAHADEGEGYGGGGDRDTLTLSTIEPRHWTVQKPAAFIQEVRAADPDVKIVVLLAVGSAVVMEDWIDAADAVIQTFYPGQEGGTAVARLLFGDVNFSGKLPFTVARNPADYPVFGNTEESITFEYLHGYRRIEANGVAPRFWFGYGLSYTSYEYGEPVVLCPEGVDEDGQLRVEVRVTNTGRMAGDEVVQLYVASPATPGLLHPPPPKALKAFTRVALEPGQSKQVQLSVPARDLRHWGRHLGSGGWELARGEHTVLVGPSADPSVLKSAPFSVN
jgi:beta-glucosidase